MIKKLLAFSIALVLTLSLSQAVYASEIGIKIVGQKEGVVHTQVVVDDIAMFPIGEILKFLDISGSETIIMNETPAHSLITFQGQCYKITHGMTEVQEYEVNETGACINATGDIRQLEKPATYLDDYRLGIFVPLSFISDISANSKYGNKFDTRYIEEDKSLEFSMYKIDDSGSKQLINPVTLAMKINSPWLLTVDDGNLFDDNDHNVTPVTRQGITLLPIAPIISQLGGQTKWDGAARKVTITLNSDTIELWIDRKSAVVNGVEKELTVAPTSINGRTMIPVRFVTENLGADIRWYKDSQMVLIYFGDAAENDTDLFNFEYKINLLDAYQKKEDNHKTLEDVVKEIQDEHSKIQYNDTDPLDYAGKMIYVGDTVGLGTFDGVVKKISGTKVLVYWNHASFLVDKGKEKETAEVFGIKWLSEQWVEAKTVTISSSGY
ncbi:copper amine oxidase N-terminal domain-containing protein [Cohnella sp.]|uniref:copper amine oxidase N-terminal domain-containing protein n=1 Tax=Cohnella sp. TaxID=1883426 RepID=UPI003566B077